jgi:hypothetical protein
MALVISSRRPGVAAEPGLVRIDVKIGKSPLIEVKEAFDRVSVTDPQWKGRRGHLPGALLSTKDSVLRPGGTERSGPSPRTAQAEQIAPRDAIEAYPARNSIILQGTVSSEELITAAAELAAVFSPKGNVVNLLSLRDVKPQQVLIQIQVAEVARRALNELGFSWRLLGNTFQGGAFPGVPFFPSELANLFFASPSRDYGGLVRALAERDLFRVLAKPNLVTESGTEASFLAGGEFPYPVSQGGAVAGAPSHRAARLPAPSQLNSSPLAWVLFSCRSCWTTGRSI